MLELVKTGGLFVVTAVAEIVGCYLPWLVLKAHRPLWLLVPAAVSLALFAWLLTLHPAAAGRTYAAYGGVYVAVAIGWLHFVDGIVPTRWDIVGIAITLLGMSVIVLQPGKVERPGKARRAAHPLPLQASHPRDDRSHFRGVLSRASRHWPMKSR